MLHQTRADRTATRAHRLIDEPRCDDRSPDKADRLYSFMCEVVEWIGLVAAVLFCLAVVGIDITLIRLVVLVWLS